MGNSREVADHGLRDADSPTSRLVMRGWHGELDSTVTTPVSFTSDFKENHAKMVVKPGLVVLFAYFEATPRSHSNMGPFSVPVTGFPKDVDAVVPVCVGVSSYSAGQKGS